MTSTYRREKKKKGKQPNKREQDLLNEEEMKEIKKNNFLIACQQSSYKSYLDNLTRVLLYATPPCATAGICNHQNSRAHLLPYIPNAAEEENFRVGTFFHPMSALVNATEHYTDKGPLTGEMLKGVAEVLLNTHHDFLAGCTPETIIYQSQDILSANLKLYPPCVRRIREAYDHFLFSPMDPKIHSYSTRQRFGSAQGILNFCFNRLQFELTHDSPEGPLLNKFEAVPREIKHTMRGLQWIQQNCLILEMLPRLQRIQRLIAVLGSAVKVLQVDLAIWTSRYVNYIPCHNVRMHRPLVALFLWGNDFARSGELNETCLRILKLVTNMIHLSYPTEYIRVMMLWVNIISQAYYLCEKNASVDFPNINVHCIELAILFYRVIADKPLATVLKVLENVQPTYLRYLIGMFHIQNIAITEESCIIKIILRFLKNSEWKKYTPNDAEIVQSQALFLKPKQALNIVELIIRLCDNLLNEEANNNGPVCPRLPPRRVVVPEEDIDVNHIIHSMFITFDAYLDAFNVLDMIETWQYLNDNIQNPNANLHIMDLGIYSTTFERVKLYRDVFCKRLRELSAVYKKMDESKQMPNAMKIFKTVDFLSLS